MRRRVQAQRTLFFFGGGEFINHQHFQHLLRTELPETVAKKTF